MGNTGGGRGSEGAAGAIGKWEETGRTKGGRKESLCARLYRLERVGGEETAANGRARAGQELTSEAPVSNAAQEGGAEAGREGRGERGRERERQPCVSYTGGRSLGLLLSLIASFRALSRSLAPEDTHTHRERAQAESARRGAREEEGAVGRKAGAEWAGQQGQQGQCKPRRSRPRRRWRTWTARYRGKSARGA